MTTRRIIRAGFSAGSCITEAFHGGADNVNFLPSGVGQREDDRVLKRRFSVKKGHSHYPCCWPWAMLNLGGWACTSLFSSGISRVFSESDGDERPTVN